MKTKIRSRRARRRQAAKTPAGPADHTSAFPETMLRHAAGVRQAGLACVKRMPAYLQLLRVLQAEGREHVSGTVLASVHNLEPVIVRKDLAKIGEARAALKKFSVEQLIEITAKAGEFFLNGTLPLGDKGHTQTPEEFIATLPSSGNMKVVCNRIDNDPGQLAIEAAWRARTTKLYQLTYPKTATQTTNGDVYIFSAIVEAATPAQQFKPSDVINYEFTLKISGLDAYTAGT